MRIEQLKYLIELSKCNSFNAASEKLNISHQCLNKAITSLENELGVTLLNRNNKGISFTIIGKETVETSKKILLELERLNDFISGQQLSDKSLLKENLQIIGTGNTINALLGPIVCEMRQVYPKVQISLAEALPLDIPSMLTEDNYDFAVVNVQDLYTEDFATNKNLVCTSLFEEKAVALVGKYSSLSNVKTISVKNILKNPIILYGTNMEKNSFTYKVLENYGSIKTCAYTNNLQFYYDSLANGLYYTVVMPSVYFSIPPMYQSKIKMIPLKEELGSITYLLQRKKQKKSPVTDDVLELLNIRCTELNNRIQKIFT